MLNRNKKMYYNSISSLVYQIFTIVSGFIMPALFLKYYGSEANGLVSSITQFLAFISLAECGVGAVVQSTLYGPLAKNDDYEVSRIIASSNKFFNKVGLILIIYTLLLMFIYPVFVTDSFGYMYTLILIFCISINTFSQYYFGITYRLLLNADQLGFIQYTVNSIAIIFNTIACVFLMQIGTSLQIVKLTTSLIFLVQPIVLTVFAKKRYHVLDNVDLSDEPIKQKWNGLAQHIASVILNNTDTVVLTICSTLKNVSIYAVYNMIVVGIKSVIVSMTNGMQALLGNMLANNEIEEANKVFDYIEWFLHSIVTLSFTITACLIVPFVTIYTKNVNDTNYIVPIFGTLLTIAYATYCLRLPYNIVILAAGHYKQTQLSAIIEALLNLVTSIILVWKYGLIGVAIGTIIAMSYRTIYFVIYLSRVILYRKVYYFVQHVKVDMLIMLMCYIVYKIINDSNIIHVFGYFDWLILALLTTICFVIVSYIINMLFYKDKVITTLNKIKLKK